MTLADVFHDTTPIKERSTELLKQQLQAIRQAKCWSGPYFQIDREVQARAVRQWVHEDVFGTADWRK